MSKINIENLDLYYGDFHALHGISMAIEPNEITAFIGPSGCGKSTFLKTLNRMNDLVEGVRIETEAVLGANVVITQSTKIIDVTQENPIEYKGIVPARSVVIPGSYTKKFNAGEYNVNCALIIGQRKKSTDTKTSLNDALREFKVSV